MSKSVEKGDVGKCAPRDPHSYGSWHKSKNAYPLRNNIIPNEATARAPETIWPVASWCLGSDSCLVGNNVIFQWVWVLAIRFWTSSLAIDAMKRQQYIEANLCKIRLL